MSTWLKGLLDHFHPSVVNHFAILEDRVLTLEKVVTELYDLKNKLVSIQPPSPNSIAATVVADSNTFTEVEGG